MAGMTVVDNDNGEFKVEGGSEILNKVLNI